MAIYKHDNFIPLDSNLTLWRYIDFDKFESLLATSSLFFCRADKFSDPFEGSIPRIEFEYRQKENSSTADGTPLGIPQLESNIKGIQRLHKLLRKKTIVNCWHINNNESDAMWRLYLKDNEGVAIQSNSLRIHQTIEQISETIAISKVRYIDFDHQGWFHPQQYPFTNYNFYVPIVHKRIEFLHENECRLFHEIDEVELDEKYWEKQDSHTGKFIKVDLKSLVEKIILPPTIDEYAENKLNMLVKKYGYNFTFEQSVLKKEPYF